MKIAFILASPDNNGGTNVIYNQAIGLHDAGHEVSIIRDEYTDPKRLEWFPDKKVKELKWETFETIADKSYDICFSTVWFSIALLPKVKAKKYFNFIQSIESKFAKPEDVALRKYIESMYTLPIPVITEVHWIKDYLAENYGNHSVAIARNGFDKSIYNTDVEPIEKPLGEGKLRVLVEGPLGYYYKNVEKTIELCTQSKADEIWWMTADKLEKNEYPGVRKVYSGLSYHENAKVYRACDVIIKLTYMEGMFSTPMLQFMCGGTVVTYDVTGYDEYVKHEENGLVVETDNEKKVVEYINRLKDNPELLKRLKANAVKTAEQWPDWNAARKEFIAAVDELKDADSPSAEWLEKTIKFNHEWFQDYERIEKSIPIRFSRRLKSNKLVHRLMNNAAKILNPKH